MLSIILCDTLLSILCQSSSLALAALFGRLRPLAHHLPHVIRLSRELGQPPDALSLKIEQPAVSAPRGSLPVKGAAHTGRGAHASARNAMSVDAQLTPRFLNIGVTKRGKLRVSTAMRTLGCRDSPDAEQ